MQVFPLLSSFYHDDYCQKKMLVFVDQSWEPMKFTLAPGLCE